MIKQEITPADSKLLQLGDIMTSRRKSKRSLSLRTSSFVRLLSPFRSGAPGHDDTTEDSEIARDTTHQETEGSSFTGRRPVTNISQTTSLHSALSDSHLNISSKSDMAWTTRNTGVNHHNITFSGSNILAIHCKIYIRHLHAIVCRKMDEKLSVSFTI